MPAKRPIYLVEASSQLLLTSTFLRFQEHYESPEFRGKIFGLDEFKVWYTKQRGSFSYYKDWAGFNFPSHILRPFEEGLFDPLSTKEQKILRIFSEITEPFYVIGAINLDIDALKHEIVHALYYFDRAYKTKVLRTLRTFDTAHLRKCLAEMGYHESVVEDEINAYLVTELAPDGTDMSDYKPLCEALGTLFSEHFGYRIAHLPDREVVKLVHRRKL